MLELDLAVVRGPRRRLPKTTGLFGEVYDFITADGQQFYFAQHFRLPFECFQAILARVSQHDSMILRSNNAAPVHHIALVALWRLANNVTIREDSMVTGYSTGFVSNYTRRFLTALCETEEEHQSINWPDHEEMLEIASNFWESRKGSYRMPNIVGVMDGSHVPFKQPPGPLKEK
jgi:hypothetical protein